jgi:hypothetical protein
MSYSDRDLCDSDDLDLKFGSATIEKYAKHQTDDDATTIGNRKDRAIAQASAEVRSILQGTNYTIPASGTIDPILVDITADLAFLWLYESAHGSEKLDEQGRPVHRYSYLRDNARWRMEMIRRGDFRLGTGMRR